MTLPKGYVAPNKEEAEQKAKLEAEQKAKLEAEQKAKLEAEQKAKLEAEQKAKLEAEQKAIPQNSQNDSLITNNLNSNRLDGKQGNVDKTLENNFNYFLIWEQLQEAYLHTMKEATSSYFRLLDFWLQQKNQEE